MAKVSERVRLMKENFMSLHNQGFTIPEIAEKYDLGRATVYQNLQDIADANNVSRDSLLKVVKTPTEKAYKAEHKRVKVDMEKLNAGFQEVKDGLDYISGLIGKILEEENNYEYTC